MKHPRVGGTEGSRRAGVRTRGSRRGREVDPLALSPESVPPVQNKKSPNPELPRNAEEEARIIISALEPIVRESQISDEETIRVLMDFDPATLENLKELIARNGGEWVAQTLPGSDNFNFSYLINEAMSRLMADEKW